MKQLAKELSDADRDGVNLSSEDASFRFTKESDENCLFNRRFCWRFRRRLTSSRLKLWTRALVAEFEAAIQDGVSPTRDGCCIKFSRVWDDSLL